MGLPRGSAGGDSYRPRRMQRRRPLPKSHQSPTLHWPGKAQRRQYPLACHSAPAVACYAAAFIARRSVLRIAAWVPRPAPLH
jgi:hypothetical protein